MKYNRNLHWPDYIARQRIHAGDAVRILWKHYCRPCYCWDSRVDGFAGNEAKTGEPVIILKNLVIN